MEETPEAPSGSNLSVPPAKGGFGRARLGLKALRAVQGSDPAALSGLLAAGADPGYAVDGSPPLIRVAAWAGDVDCARVLLDAGVDPDGFPPGMPEEGGSLYFCSGLQSTECLELLLARGADPDGGCKEQGSRRPSPLMDAVHGGRAAAVRLLGAAGADMDVEEADETALIAAVERGGPDCVDACLEFGADPNFRSFGGRTAAMLALTHPDDACMRALCKGGFDLSVPDNRGLTVAEQAAMDSERPAAKFLLGFLLAREEAAQLASAAAPASSAQRKPGL